MSSTKFIYLLILSFVCTLSNSSVAYAQVILDNSLGDESSVVTPNATIKDAPADLIEGGATRGSNLFHSFSDFNVGDGSAVYFASPEGINNILTRVTGNSVSNIFGTLGVVNGAANLFLLNPNGIVFGQDAVLDLNGSFFATTAESFLDAQDNKFSAVQSDTKPLLNVNLTPGLQMGSHSGNITVKGNGHLLTGGVLFPLNNLNNNTASRLQVKTGQTLGLIARQIQLDGGILKIPGGNIELAGIQQGNVYFEIDADTSSWQFDSSQVAKFGDIKLRDRALLDTSGILTGDIRLQGKNISLEDASAAIIQNFGTEISGEIIVNATDSITLSNSIRNSADIPTPQGNITGIASSRFTTETLGTGKGGNLKISGKNLWLDDSSSISSRSFSNAETGNLELKFGESININGASLLNPLVPTSLSTLIFSSGNSGKIDVVARNISLNDSGTISSLNFGSGKGGDINVRAAELKFDSINSPSGNPSSIGSTIYRTGDSGSVTMDASRISLLNGSKISTSTLAQGNAGKITINSSDYIEISGVIPGGGLESSISSDAEILNLGLQQFLGIPDIPSGDSGNVIVNTPQLTISNGGSVAVNNRGLGDSGDVMLSGDRILLNDNASITAFSTSGQGGNISLSVNDFLSLDNSSTITARATGNFTDSNARINGGNIVIDADLITLLENSQIDASAVVGNGGNINITAQGFLVSADSLVRASSEFGLDGNVEVDTINGDRKFELGKLPENTIRANQQIAASCGIGANQFAISRKGGLPSNPTQNLRGQAVWNDMRLIDLRSTSKTFKSSSLDPLPHQPKLILEAQGWRINKKGHVVLIKQENQPHLISNQTNCRKY